MVNFFGHILPLTAWFSRKNACSLCEADQYICIRCGEDVVDHVCGCARLGYHGASPWAIKTEWPKPRPVEYGGDHFVDWLCSNGQIVTNWHKACEIEEAVNGKR